MDDAGGELARLEDGKDAVIIRLAYLVCHQGWLGVETVSNSCSVLIGLHTNTSLCVSPVGELPSASENSSSGLRTPPAARRNVIETDLTSSYVLVQLPLGACIVVHQTWLDQVHSARLAPSRTARRALNVPLSCVAHRRHISDSLSLMRFL